MLDTYYTVRVFWAPRPNQWTPTEQTGPLSVLTRGAFKTYDEALCWALDNLDGAPYQVQLVTYNDR